MVYLEVGRRLLLDLVGEGVDLEPVQTRYKLNNNRFLFAVYNDKTYILKAIKYTSRYFHLNGHIYAVILDPFASAF